MKALKVRIEGGQLIGPAPAGLAEGTELELCLAEPEDDMTEEEIAALDRVLEAAWASLEAGRVRPVDELLTELRARP